MALTRQLKVLFDAEDYSAWLALAERLGKRPATLARMALSDFMKEHGFDTKAGGVSELLAGNDEKPSVYFTVSAEQAKALNDMAWDYHKPRYALVAELVIKALEEWQQEKGYEKAVNC